MIWTKSPNSFHEAKYKGAEAYICKTGTLPETPIPEKERWMLDINGSGYTYYATGPTIKGLKAKAKRVIDALEEIK